MLVHCHNVPSVERHLESMVVWMNETPMDLNRPYLIKHTTQMVRSRVDEVRYKVDVDNLKATIDYERMQVKINDTPLTVVDQIYARINTIVIPLIFLDFLSF